MGRKPTNAALYELFGRKQAEKQGPRQPPPPDPGPGPGPGSGWFGAGRTLRLPVGYIWLGGGGGILLLALAFSAGYVRGHGEATTTLEREFLTQQGALPVPPPEVQPGFVQQPTATRTETPAVSPATTAKPSGPGEILSDPRVKGLNYLILIHTQRDNAVELARFCRQGGVEAYAVPVKDGVLYRVIARPGYAGGDRSSEPVRALEQRIAQVIRQWKLQVNPRDELAYYPERFGG